MNKENIKKTSLIILGILLLGGWFYWFQYRPAQIRHDCSWAKQYTGAISARSAMTEEELKNNGMLKDCADSKYVRQNNNMFNECDKTPLLPTQLLGCSCYLSNRNIIEEYKQAKPAVPGKDWWLEATDEEYKFCLRDRGL